MEVAAILSDFLATHLPKTISVTVCPVADGGDDTLAVLQQAEGNPVWQSALVTGPVADSQVSTRYLHFPEEKTIVIESAQAHGLKLLGEHLAPMTATSYGVGELIRQAVERHQPDKVVVTVGGSASTDGGAGALQALGVVFLDACGNPLKPPLSGEALCQIQAIQWPSVWPYPSALVIATDVQNPLLGISGSAQVFAPQKGANAVQVEQLEAGLTHFRNCMIQLCGEDWSALPGMGAAGGLAYGLCHWPQSRLASGSQWLADALALPEKIAQASMILTGEGRFDETSYSGKATGQLMKWAEPKPVFLFCGQIQSDLTLPEHVQAFPLVAELESPAFALKNPRAALRVQLEKALPQLQSLLAGVM